jgi:hypothetical protein
VTSVSNGLVGAASGGDDWDMDPKGQRRIGDAAGGANGWAVIGAGLHPAS